LGLNFIPKHTPTRAQSESASKKRKGKREYLNDEETKRIMRELEMFFESNVEIPLIIHGKRQRIDTLINEEALLLAEVP
jgi:hypothetical protein